MTRASFALLPSLSSAKTSAFCESFRIARPPTWVTFPAATLSPCFRDSAAVRSLPGRNAKSHFAPRISVDSSGGAVCTSAGCSLRGWAQPSASRNRLSRRKDTDERAALDQPSAGRIPPRVLRSAEKRLSAPPPHATQAGDAIDCDHGIATELAAVRFP